MDADRFQQVQAIVDGALDLTPADRAQWLHNACAGDAALRLEVERLLRSIDAADEDAFLETAAPPIEVVGSAQRRYRMLREIGRGGMGTVWLAERSDGEFTQQVALKTLDVDASRAPMLAQRLRIERQILAQLAHPNIARLLDGGSDARGRPFLVMEYIQGERIDHWCERMALSVEARVRLFLKVCDAVQYAHRQLVIHRDIKPANILVDADGVPKLLDFGIAKLLDDDMEAATATADRMLTVRYASPEQIRGEAVGTASDLYSLAVVLYALLTGQLPYAAATAADPEFARAVLDDSPRAPSRSVGAQTLPAANASTLKPDASLARRLAGDLDAILLKALRKEPDERYASVAQFGDELRRHLAGLPVTARQGQRGYALRRFVARHRWAVAAAGLALGALIAFTATLQQQLARTARERDRANAVTHFLTGMFEQGNPMRDGAGSGAQAQLTVREVLDRQAPRIERELAGQPEVQAALLASIGRVYVGLDDSASAERYLSAALERLRQIDPAPSREQLDLLLFSCQNDGVGGRERTLASCDAALAMARQISAGDDFDFDLGRALRGRAAALRIVGRHAEAERAALQALAVFEHLHDLQWSAGIHQDLADLAYLRGDPQGCLREIDLALEQWTRTHGQEHALRALPLQIRANCLAARGQLKEAETDLRESLRLTEQALGADRDSAARATTLNSLGLVLNQQGRFAEAEKVLREALRIDRAVYGPDHPEVGTVLSNLSASVDGQMRVDEGIELLRAALAIQQTRSGDDRRSLALVQNNLGYRLLREHRYAQAEPWLRAALATYEAIDPKHAERATTLVNLGILLTDTQRPAEALALLKEGLALRERTFAADSWQLDVTRSALGACLAALGDFTHAEPMLIDAHAKLLQAFGPAHRRTQDAAQRLLQARQRNESR